MPNWCDNELRVRGAAEDLERFRTDVRREGDDDQEASELSFAAHLPVPEDLPPSPPRGNMGEAVAQLTGISPRPPRSKYEWVLRYWGTKWDVADAVVDRRPDRLIYRFDTAWSPPVSWLEHVAKEYPHLEFDLFFAEAGAGFCGRVSYSRGRLVSERSIDDFEEGAAWLNRHGLYWWDFALDDEDEGDD